MPGLIFTVRNNPSNPNNLYPSHLCRSCASQAVDRSSPLVAEKTNNGSLADTIPIFCPICGFSLLISPNDAINMHKIGCPELQLEVHELRRLLENKEREFSGTNILRYSDSGALSVLPSSGPAAIEYLRKWRQENPTKILPKENFVQMMMLSDLPELKSSVLDAMKRSMREYEESESLPPRSSH